MKLFWLITALLVPLTLVLGNEESNFETKNYDTLLKYLNAVRVLIEEEEEEAVYSSTTADGNIEQEYISFGLRRQKRSSSSSYENFHPEYYEEFPAQYGDEPDKDSTARNVFVDVIPSDTRLEIEVIEENGQKQIVLRPAQYEQIADRRIMPDENPQHYGSDEIVDFQDLPNPNPLENVHEHPGGYDTYQQNENSNPYSNNEVVFINNPFDSQSVLSPIIEMTHSYYGPEEYTEHVQSYPSEMEGSYDSEMSNRTFVYGDHIHTNAVNYSDESMLSKSQLAAGDIQLPFTGNTTAAIRETDRVSISTSSIPYADHINLDNENEVIGSGYTQTDYPFEGSGELDARGLAETNEGRTPEKKASRFIELFSDVNDTLTRCTTPKNESGYCRHFRHCLLHEVLNNFNSFLQYTCLMKSRFVGICCPDNPVVKVTYPDDENSTKSNTEEILPVQPLDGCGVNSKTRIVGGTISKPHEWTWMVALLRRDRFFCGGVLINNRYVLTAAHCILGMNIKDLTVRLGEYNLNNKTEQQQDIGIAEIKRHAQFTTLTFQHDIALLKLRRQVIFTRFVGTICLPSVQDFNDVNATVVGWGTVSFGGAASPVLRQATIPVLKNSDCDRIYSLENIDESFMCAGSPDDEQDACQGDSGGPLMNLNDAGRWQVIGLVSWGRRCGDPEYPGVYTRVTSYLDWIKENIR